MADMKSCPRFEVHNDYYTPKSAWENINHLIPNDKTIWECCMLNSHLSKSKEHLQSLGKTVIGETFWDFFEIYDKIDYDMIITNPPFETKLKQDILKILVKIDKPFILIMNSMNLYANYFKEIFSGKEKDLQIVFPKGKIHFERLMENGEIERKNNTSFYCVYVTYKMNIPNEKLYLK